MLKWIQKLDTQQVTERDPQAGNKMKKDPSTVTFD
jgi:hypothetical protein